MPDSKGVSDWVVEGERVSEFAGEVLELADTLREAESWGLGEEDSDAVVLTDGVRVP